jgi:hypothetical protein
LLVANHLVFPVFRVKHALQMAYFRILFRSDLPPRCQAAWVGQ